MKHYAGLEQELYNAKYIFHDSEKTEKLWNKVRNDKSLLE